MLCEDIGLELLVSIVMLLPEDDKVNTQRKAEVGESQGTRAQVLFTQVLGFLHKQSSIECIDVHMPTSMQKPPW